MSEQVGSVTHKKSSDFHGGIRFQSSFTIRWELEDKDFLKIDIMCLDDSLKYRIMAIKTNENFIPFSNSVTFRKPRGTDLVTASELIPGFCRSKLNVPTPGSLRTIKSPIAGMVPGIKSPPLARTPPPPPHGIYIDRCITGDDSQRLFIFSATLLQHCCNIVSNGYSIVQTLQRCFVLKIVVANRPV